MKILKIQKQLPFRAWVNIHLFCSHFILLTKFNRHVGDLGNIIADASGLAKIDIADGLVKLSGEHSVIGRSIVVRTFSESNSCGILYKINVSC